jgi:hypothetical protein
LAAGVLFEGCTPDLLTHTRADELIAWLQEHPEVKDTQLWMTARFQVIHYSRPRFKHGLTEQLCKAVILHSKKA